VELADSRYENSSPTAALLPWYSSRCDAQTWGNLWCGACEYGLFPRAEFSESSPMVIAAVSAWRITSRERAFTAAATFWVALPSNQIVRWR